MGYEDHQVAPRIMQDQNKGQTIAGNPPNSTDFDNSKKFKLKIGRERN